MAVTYKKEQLSRREDLLPVFSGKSEEPVAFVFSEDQRFQGNLDSYLNLLRRTGLNQPVFRICKYSSKRYGQPIYADLSNFRQTDTSWETSLYDEQKAVKRETAHRFRDNNLPFLRKYMVGESEGRIFCPLTGQQVDALEAFPGIVINIWEQHHFKVRNRASIQKESADPGEILRSMDFAIAGGQTLEAIKDMMRTIFLSPTGHKIVHNAWNDSDIRNYSNDQRPWALNNHSNWNDWLDFLESYGYSRDLFGSLNDWLLDLELTESDLAC